MKPYHLPSLQQFFESRGISDLPRVVIPDEKRGEAFLLFTDDSTDPLHVGPLDTASWTVYANRSEMARGIGDEFPVKDGDVLCSQSFAGAVECAISERPAVIHILRDDLTLEKLREVPALTSYVEDDGQVMFGIHNVTSLLRPSGNDEAPEENPGASR